MWAGRPPPSWWQIGVGTGRARIRPAKVGVVEIDGGADPKLTPVGWTTGSIDEKTGVPSTVMNTVRNLDVEINLDHVGPRGRHDDRRLADPFRGRPEERSGEEVGEAVEVAALPGHGHHVLGVAPPVTRSGWRLPRFGARQGHLEPPGATLGPEFDGVPDIPVELVHAGAVSDHGQAEGRCSSG